MNIDTTTRVDLTYEEVREALDAYVRDNDPNMYNSVKKIRGQVISIACYIPANSHPGPTCATILFGELPSSPAPTPEPITPPPNVTSIPQEGTSPTD